MPPSRSRPVPDDSESSSREKHASSGNGKNRRIANGANAGSSLQNVANANPAATNPSVGAAVSQDNVIYSHRTHHRNKANK